MKTCFEIKDGSLSAGGPVDAPIIVYALPDEAEKRELLETGHDLHDLESALDPDEISRVEFGPQDTYFIWKRPHNASHERRLRFEVSSAGLLLKKDRLTFILGEESPPFDGKEFEKVGSLNGLVLKFFLQTVRRYLGHLKAIKQLTAELQANLNQSMENRYLIQMFSLSESLIYYLNAIEANAAVLTQLRANAERAGFSRDEVRALDDIIIDYRQCGRQTQIYSSVLSGLMDARGNIINNNMNVLLKNLTLINVVFLPLGLIAGIGGMSEFSAATHGADWRVSYSLLALAMAALGWITWILLAWIINRQRTAGTGGNAGSPEDSRRAGGKPRVSAGSARGREAPW